MNTRQNVVRMFVLIMSLLLAGCAQAAPTTATPTALESNSVPAVTDPAAGVGRSEPSPAAPTVVTATLAPTATQPPTDALVANAPAARLVRNTPVGECQWDVYMYLTGFAPNNLITVMSNFDEVQCPTGKVGAGESWTEVYGTKTDARGSLMIGYLHEATGSYLYTFTDEQGHQASLPFTTEPESTRTPRVEAPTALSTRSASPTKAALATATPAPEPLVIVKSSALNLRSGPGQDYPVIGQVASGDQLYPTGRVGSCEWLQVGVLGQSDLVWVAGVPEYVTLTVPCESLRVQDLIPPTPFPAPTAVPRPATGLLSRSESPSGSGTLLIENGTDSDGVVLLIDLGSSPAQAAYIRAGESFEMTGIRDGAYRLYFSKGEGWDVTLKQFTRNVIRQRFEETLQFGGQYGGYEVTLYGVAGGNAATENVPAGQFPTVP